MLSAISGGLKFALEKKVDDLVREYGGDQYFPTAPKKIGGDQSVQEIQEEFETSDETTTAIQKDGLNRGERRLQRRIGGRKENN